MKKAIFLGVFLALIVPVTSFAALDINLKYGSSGASVTELQEFLKTDGEYTGSTTGNFYSITLAAIKNFQINHGISPVSGYWGPLTRAKAQSILNIGASNDDEISETGIVSKVPVQNTSVPPVDNIPCINDSKYSFITGTACDNSSNSTSNSSISSNISITPNTVNPQNSYKTRDQISSDAFNMKLIIQNSVGQLKSELSLVQNQEKQYSSGGETLEQVQADINRPQTTSNMNSLQNLYSLLIQEKNLNQVINSYTQNQYNTRAQNCTSDSTINPSDVQFCQSLWAIASSTSD